MFGSHSHHPTKQASPNLRVRLLLRTTCERDSVTSASYRNARDKRQRPETDTSSPGVRAEAVFSENVLCVVLVTAQAAVSGTRRGKREIRGGDVAGEPVLDLV